MPYSLEDLDNALANSVGPRQWEANEPGNHGFARIIMIDRAATVRWHRQMPEDDDARIIREAYSDLCKDGFFRFEGGWEGEDG